MKSKFRIDEPVGSIFDLSVPQSSGNAERVEKWFNIYKSLKLADLVIYPFKKVTKDLQARLVSNYIMPSSRLNLGLNLCFICAVCSAHRFRRTLGTAFDVYGQIVKNGIGCYAISVDEKEQLRKLIWRDYKELMKRLIP